MTPPRVLLIGGNGRTARRITPLLLAKSWHVTSVIRRSSQRGSILSLAAGQPGSLEVFETDLEHIRTDDDALAIINHTNPNYVIWAAGALGSDANVYAIDRDAAKHVINACTGTPSVTKFLMISFPASRRNRAPWWSDRDWQEYRSETAMFGAIQKARVEADEHLVAAAHRRAAEGGPKFQAISLRPSWLTDGPASGRVELGRTKFSGRLSRGDVAAVAVELLAREDTSGWFDLVERSTPVEEAVDQVVREGVNCIEGEDIDRILSLRQ